MLDVSGSVSVVLGVSGSAVAVLVSVSWVSFGTVYTLWSYPDLLPTFTTWPLVLEKLVGGAGKRIFLCSSNGLKCLQ